MRQRRKGPTHVRQDLLLLRGVLSERLWTLRSLRTLLLDATSNVFRLSGALPDDLVERLPDLKSLSLQRQNISGHVPTSMGRLRCSDTHYADAMPQCLIWLSNNPLSGSIPRSLCNATFGEFYAANTSFSCPLPCISAAYETFGDTCSGVPCQKC